MSRENSPSSFHELSPLRQELIGELRQNSARAVMFHQLISEQLGLNATDHKCLDFLNRTGPVTAGQLAQLTGLTTGAVTSVIDRLEKAGYVVRDKDPNDRRRVVVKTVSDSTAGISPCSPPFWSQRYGCWRLTRKRRRPLFWISSSGPTR
ncbi:MarR family transcriptional regulator [Paenibacillus sp. CC-CFT747]|nr:MarR family transcriptional regulator [Paenibacillus sp. CC-CFT747]